MKSRVILLVALLTITTGLGLYFVSETAEAQLSPLRRGYFNNSTGPPNMDIGVVLRNGLMNGNYPTGSTARSTVLNTANHAFTLTNKAQFINHIENEFNGGGRDRTGAAFIIQNMRGVASPNGEANFPTAAEIQDWKNRINQPNVTLEIQSYPGGNINSAYMAGGSFRETTTHWRPMTCFGNNCIPDTSSPPGAPYTNCSRTGSVSGSNEQWRCLYKSYPAVNDVMFFSSSSNFLPALVFRQSGVEKVKIKINCGNMLGNIGLDYDPWIYDMSPLSASPGNFGTSHTGRPTINVQRGSDFTISSTVTNRGPAAGPQYYHIMRPVNNTHNNWMRSYLTRNGFSDPGGDSAGNGVGGYSAASHGYKTTPGPLAGNGSNFIANATYSMSAATPINQVFCWFGIMDPFPAGGADRFQSPVNEQICVRVVDSPPASSPWNYSVGVNVPASVQPGAEFNVSSLVDNQTSNQGLPYDQSINTYEGENYLTMVDGGPNPNLASKDAGWVRAVNPGLTTNTRTRTGRWRLASNTPNGTQVCFRGAIYPSEGDGATITLGYKESNKVCFTVNVVSSPWNYSVGVNVPASVQPGAEFNVSSLVDNQTSNQGLPYDQSINTYEGENYLTMVDGGPNPNLASKDAGWVRAVNPGLTTNTRTRTGRWRLASNTPNGTQVCFRGAIYPSEGDGATITLGYKESNKVCFTVIRNLYNYVPDTTINGSNFPGSVLDIDGKITNSESAGQGASYTETIVVYWGNAFVTGSNGSWNGETGLVGGDSRTRDIAYTINNDAPHAELICFRTTVTPSNGLATPGTTTSNGSASSEDCIRVNNERFDLSPPAISFSENVVGPGDFIDVTYTVCNDHNTHWPPGALRGDAPSVNITTLPDDIDPGVNSTPPTIGAGACWTTTANNVQIPPAASPGDQICTTARASKHYGFTNGAGLAGGTPTNQECVTVAIAPYLQVEDGDVWAGANFDNSNPPLVPNETLPASCGGPTNENSKIASVTSGISGLWRGSFVEYAAFATGPISGFGTDGEPSVPGPANLTALTFANTDLSNLGSYTNNPKCIANYFELLTDPNHTYSAANSSTSNGNNLNSVTNTEEQSYVKPNDGTYDLNGGNSNITGNRTLVVEGNLHISTDVTFSNYNYNNSNNLAVPSLIFVVSGDIFIDEAVETIDAILISHGTIWTCSSGATATTAVAANICQNPLTINGAIIASRVNFMRTHEGGGNIGGVHDPNSQPAEKVIFNPEFYLSKPVFKSDLIGQDSFKTVLVKDLPPIY